MHLQKCYGAASTPLELWEGLGTVSTVETKQSNIQAARPPSQMGAGRLKLAISQGHAMRMLRCQLDLYSKSNENLPGEVCVHPMHL